MKEKRSLENLLRTPILVGEGKNARELLPDMIIKTQQPVNGGGVHVTIHAHGYDSDTLDYTVVDNKLIPHFVTRNEGGMSFGEAIVRMRMGVRVARAGWNGKDMYLAIQEPDEKSANTDAYIYMSYPDKAQKGDRGRVPWLASQNDMLCNDWAVVLIK